MKFFYDYTIKPRDPNQKFTESFQTAIGCDDKMIFSQCSRELVEMQYLKSNWSEISKKGVYFLDFIRGGDLDFNDEHVDIGLIVNAFERTEEFFGRTYARINLDEDSNTNLQNYANEVLKNQQKSHPAIQ